MIYVLYHANCPDGLTAAGVAKWYFEGGFFRSAVTYIPCNYGHKAKEYLPSIGSGDDVYILDFSFPRDQLVELRGDVKSLVVLDHHKTAQADLGGLDFCQFDMGRSGAVMAWDHFFPGRAAPDFVLYVQDRDLWQWKLPRSREFSAGLQVRTWGVDVFEWMMRKPGMVDELKSDGVVAIMLKDQQVEIMAKRARMAVFDWGDKPRIFFGGQATGTKQALVPVANAACFFSEVGEEMCRAYPESPFSAYYFDREDGKRQWGLRARGGFDSSIVAKAFGGGGHPGASGFVMDSPGV